MAASLICIIAVADYATGYAVRLSILYLVPIAMTAWLAGTAMGIAAAVLTSTLWMLSFQSEHFYQDQGYYLWEAGVKLCSNLAFAWLIARLRLALSQADERFLRVLEEMRAAVYVADERRDEIVYANPEMIRIVGDPHAIAPSEFQEQFIREPRTPDVLPSTQAGDGVASDTFKNKRNSRWYLMRDGTIPWGSNPDVKLRVLTDITERINAEQLREKHLAVMHHAAQLATLAEIAATLAHEINQPLMVIATYTEACQNLLGMPEIDRDEISRALAKCHNQAVRAASIIERLREFIRQRQHRPSLCDAQVVVEEALDVMRSSLDEAHITVNAARVTPAISFVADKLLIVQVLTNLIRNAVEAMREMEPERRSAFHRHQVFRTRVKYSLRSRITVPGWMPPPGNWHLRRSIPPSRTAWGLGSPFAAPWSRPTEAGYGQLIIPTAARSFIFLFLLATRLTMQTRQKRYSSSMTTRICVRRCPCSCAPQACGRRFSPRRRNFFSGWIRATHGCLVLDIRMPGMTGMELQAELHKRRIRMPIVFLTGHGDVPLAVSAMKAGAFDFIQKPLDAHRLVISVMKALKDDGGSGNPPLVAAGNAEKLSSLSERQNEVLRLLMDGKQNSEIADVLCISIKTVEFHRAGIRKKLGVATLSELFKVVFENQK